jgi:hypothetical protein
MMTLQQLNQEIANLSPSDRLKLVHLIIQSLESELDESVETLMQDQSHSSKIALIPKMCGFLKNDQPTI